MQEELASWKYICDYQGQHPGYAELDAPPHPIDVRIYGRGNKRKAISKATGEVEFIYVVYTDNVERAKSKKSAQSV